MLYTKWLLTAGKVSVLTEVYYSKCYSFNNSEIPKGITLTLTLPIKATYYCYPFSVQTHKKGRSRFYHALTKILAHKVCVLRDHHNA